MGEGTFVKMSGDETNASGARYALTGDQMSANGSAVRGDIESSEASEPWGNDKFGKQFLEKYRPDGDQDDSLAYLTDGGEQFSGVGDGVQWAAVGGIDADSQAKQAIHSLETDKPKVTGPTGADVPPGGGQNSGGQNSGGQNNGGQNNGGHHSGGQQGDTGSTGPDGTTMFAAVETTGPDPTSGEPDRRVMLAEVASTGTLMLQPVDGPMPHDGDRRLVHDVYRDGVGWVTEGVQAEDPAQPGDETGQLRLMRTAGEDWDGSQSGGGQLPGHHLSAMQVGYEPDADSNAVTGDGELRNGEGSGSDDVATGYGEFRPAGPQLATEQLNVDGQDQPNNGDERYVQEVYQEGTGWTTVGSLQGTPGESADAVSGEGAITYQARTQQV